MPRVRRADVHRIETRIVADQLAAIVGEPREKKRRLMPASKAATEMHIMRVNDDWTAARAVHFVALYAWCHEQVYGVEPAELTTGKAGSRIRLQATSAAARLLSKEFTGRPKAMAGFMKWVWQREKDREEWAARTGANRGRVTWYKQFEERTMLTEFKVELGRNATR